MYNINEVKSVNRKLKIIIETDGHQLKIPAISLNLAWLFIKSGVWQNNHYVRNKPEIKELLSTNKNLILNTTRQLMAELNDCEPFVIVEINSKDEYILIELI